MVYSPCDGANLQKAKERQTRQFILIADEKTRIQILLSFKAQLS